MMQFTLDDETKLIELLKLLLSGQQYKLLLTKNDEPIVNITLEKESELEHLEKPKRYFGMFKDQIKLAPDFDEWFDAMDAEILKDFSDDFYYAR